MKLQATDRLYGKNLFLVFNLQSVYKPANIYSTFRRWSSSCFVAAPSRVHKPSARDERINQQIGRRRLPPPHSTAYETSSQSRWSAVPPSWTLLVIVVVASKFKNGTNTTLVFKPKKSPLVHKFQFLSSLSRFPEFSWSKYARWTCLPPPNLQATLTLFLRKQKKRMCFNAVTFFAQNGKTNIKRKVTGMKVIEQATGITVDSSTLPFHSSTLQGFMESYDRLGFLLFLYAVLLSQHTRP